MRNIGKIEFRINLTQLRISINDYTKDGTLIEALNVAEQFAISTHLNSLSTTKPMRSASAFEKLDVKSECEIAMLNICPIFFLKFRNKFANC